jgi:hypothetical protein
MIKLIMRIPFDDGNEREHIKQPTFRVSRKPLLTGLLG